MEVVTSIGRLGAINAVLSCRNGGMNITPAWSLRNLLPCRNLSRDGPPKLSLSFRRFEWGLQEACNYQRWYNIVISVNFSPHLHKGNHTYWPWNGLVGFYFWCFQKEREFCHSGVLFNPLMRTKCAIESPSFGVFDDSRVVSNGGGIFRRTLEEIFFVDSSWLLLHTASV